MHSTFGSPCKRSIWSETHRNKFIPFIRYHNHPTLLRYEPNMTHPTVVCNRINDPNFQPLYDLFCNYFLNKREFNLLWCSILVLLSGMSWILWEQIPGEIPIIFAIVHPMAHSNLFNSVTKHFTCGNLKYTSVITGKVSSLPRSTYLKCSGTTLSSNLILPQ